MKVMARYRGSGESCSPCSIYEAPRFPAPGFKCFDGEGCLRQDGSCKCEGTLKFDRSSFLLYFWFSWIGIFRYQVVEARNELVAMMEGHLLDHPSREEVEAGKITIRELRQELESARAENKKLSGELNVANTTRKHKFYEGSFPRDFVVKAVLREISEETRFVVICLS